jgi:hypothetical protein
MRLLLILAPVLVFAATIFLTLNHELVLTSDLLSVIYVFCILAIYGLVGVYLRYVWKNDALSEDRKVFWTLLLVSTNVVTQIFYWYRYLRNQKV